MKPKNRGQLINYGLRQLGAPVLEINLDDDQLHDAVDDTVQIYQERHYDGIERMFLKYKITQDDIDRGTAKGTDGVGIVTTTGIQTSNVTVSNNLRREGQSGAIQNLSTSPDAVTNTYTNKPHWTSTLDGGTF